MGDHLVVLWGQVMQALHGGLKMCLTRSCVQLQPNCMALLTFYTFVDIALQDAARRALRGFFGVVVHGCPNDSRKYLDHFLGLGTTDYKGPYTPERGNNKSITAI